MKNPKSDRELRKGFTKEGFKTLKELDSGEYGVVFDVEQEVNKTRFAMKVVANTDLSEQEQDMLWIVQESDDQGRKRSPKYIMEISSTFCDDDYSYFVMERLGYSLQNAVKISDGQLNKNNTCRVIMQMTLALKYLASKKICHRDIHHGNVMFDRNASKCVLVDYGVAINKELRADDVSGADFSRVEHVSPRVNRGEIYDTWDDMVSLTFIGLRCRLKNKYPNFNHHQSAMIAEKKEKFLNDPGTKLKDNNKFLIAIVEKIWKSSGRQKHYGDVVKTIQNQCPNVNLKGPFERDKAKLR